MIHPFVYWGRGSGTGPFRLSMYRGHVTAVFLLTTLCHLASKPVHAAGTDLFSLSLEQLSQITVRSVDFFETSLARSPSNIQVITHEDIDSLPALTLNDIVQMYVPGAHLSSHNSQGHHFAVRGIARGGSAKTLVMWDGHSLNQRNNFGNMSVYSSHLLGDLEQIEFVLGPGSLVHGTGALNGYVNFVPKSGFDHPGFHTRVDLGLDDDLVKLQLGYGKRYGYNKHFYLYGGYVQADGFPFGDDFGGATASLQPVRRAFAANPRDEVFEYRPSYKLSGNWTHDRLNVKVLFEYQEVDTNSPIAEFEPFDQKTLLSIQPRYTHALNHTDFLEIAPSLTWFDKALVRRARSPGVQDDEGGGSERAGELKAIYQTERFSGQKIAVGVVYTARDSTSLRNVFSSDPNRNITFTDGDWYEYAVFAEDRIELSDRTDLTLGLRRDWANFDEFTSEIDRFPNITFEPDDVSHTSPRVALTHDLYENHTVRLSYQEGFRYPDISQYPRAAAVNNVLEAFGRDPLPSLEPESVESFEIGLNSRFPASRVNARLTLYYNRYEDLIGFRNIRVDPPLVPPEVSAAIPRQVSGLDINSEDSFASVGGELSILWDPTPNWRTTLGYAYSVPSGLSEETNLNLAIANTSRSEWSVYPKHQVKAGFEYRIGKWLLALSALYESEVDTDETLGGEPVFDDDFTRVNAMLQYRIRDNLTAFAIGKNVFDDDTPPLNTTPSRPWTGTLGTDERLFYVGLRWQPGAAR